MVLSISKNIHFLRIARIFFVVPGIFFLLVLIIAFTELPFWGIHWLGTSKSEMRGTPVAIILLGGGGMPGAENLMRIWYTGNAASGFPGAGIIIAMPGDTTDLKSTPQLMKKELVMRGVNSSRIHFESEGTNTRAQALKCSSALNPDDPVLLVTSPEHTRRAVLTFRKAGFSRVFALPAFENAAEADFTIIDKELGGRKNIAPAVSNTISMRYQVWNHLKYEISFLREFIALQYYRLRGWI